MAELRLKVLADLSRIKSDIKDLMKEKLNIGVADGGIGVGKVSKKGGKSTLGLLGSILKVLGPVALLLSLKPIQDILSLLLNFTLFALLKMLKFLGLIDSDIKEQVKQSAEGIKQDALDEVITNGRNIIGSVDSAKEVSLREAIKLQDVLKKIGIDTENGWITNANIIRNALELEGIDTKNFSDEFLKTLTDNHSENITELGELSGLTKKLRDLAVGVPTILKDVKAGIVDSNKSTTDEIINQLDTIHNEDIKIAEDTLEQTKSLPQRIWDKIKELATLIAEKLKGIFSFFGGRKVGDVIIRPDGRVIETSPDDTLIATKTPETIGGGGNTFIFNGVTPQEMIDVMKRELGVGNIGVSRF